ncbi:MAG: helix-turn-helix domain-containing protein [bacterium]|nr:helix-turn-helix domain-containing protein [bacterium]
MNEDLLTISEAAQFLGVSIDSLRRWDKSGKLVAIRKDGGTHRYYTKKDLELFDSDLLQMAHEWASSGGEIPGQLYCSNSATFQARLIKLQNLLIRDDHTKRTFSLIVSTAGEIGNNSFDHNLGQWPDVPGIFFGYDVSRRIVILADRGIGILQTLSRVRPELQSDQGALKVAFTEKVSGRAPESRGNGLKYVREVILENAINLYFQSGDAELRLKGENPELRITRSVEKIRGCLASITF